MPFYLEYELGKACDTLVRELFKLKPQETLVITADTRSDNRVVETTAQAALTCGAFPMVIGLAAPAGFGRAADAALPIDTLTGALVATDTWVDYSSEGLLYSTPYEKAITTNPKLRYLCLEGMNTDMMVRCIGGVDFSALSKLLEAVTVMTERAKRVRITTPAGGNIKFYNQTDQKIVIELGYAHLPGAHMMGGQIGWRPAMETVNGTIVFDGSVSPTIGLLTTPIALQVHDGVIVKIEGGKEATQYEKWLKSWNHPIMLQMAHIDYGFNPGAKLTGNVLEDERIWGATEWGIGHVGEFFVPGGIPGPSHSDGICLNSSVWLDDIQLTHQGQIIHPDLIPLAREVGK
jgi:2,5-dihydroxypyridine 5,6-dioxygenase